MKSLSLIFVFILTLPTLAQAKPTCKEQIAFVRATIKVLEKTIQECKEQWDGTCNMAISSNHEAVLDGLDYAYQICPKEWVEKLKKVEKAFDNGK
jgi:hypothetical protein